MSEDTLSVQSSLGPMDVRFGWSGWVSITTPQSAGASYVAKRLVPTEDDLADLLSSFGLPDREADALARELWRHRPRTSEAEAEADEPAQAKGGSRRPLVVAACVLAVVLAVAALLAATLA